jgi:ribosomal protein L11 methyltransferase
LRVFYSLSVAILSYQVLVIAAASEQLDLLTSWLMQAGSLGVIPETGNALRAYFTGDTDLSVVFADCTAQFPQARLIAQNQFALDQDRAEALSFEPFQLTSEYWVVDCRALDTQRLVETIIIDPGPSFGSGKHDTTQLCAQLMAELNLKDKAFLDVGCGSGILSLLAAKLGASRITAVDIEIDARLNTQRNFSLNAVQDATILSDLNDDVSTYEIIAANMLAPTLIFLAPQILKRLKPCGILILSGLLASEIDEICRAFGISRNSADTTLRTQNEWVGICSRGIVRIS